MDPRQSRSTWSDSAAARACDIGRRRFAALALAVPASAASAFRPSWARTELPDELYSATAIVTGFDMRSRPAGFAQCLREVAVKLTGDPSLSSDPQLAAAARQADRYVLDFTYFDPIARRRPHDDQGSYDRSYDLTVRFDRHRVDDLVTSIGRKLWAGPRPTVVPAIRLRSEVPPWAGDFLLTSEAPQGNPQREAFANASVKYGIPIELPSDTMASVLAPAVDGDAQPPDGAPDRIVITGALEFRPADLGWTGRWRTRWRGGSYGASIKGVGFDRAFDELVRGAVSLAAGTGPFG